VTDPGSVAIESMDYRFESRSGAPYMDVFALLALAAYAALAVWLYRPTASRPFDMVDFSEFLPILREHDSLGSRFTGLVDYYRRQGRLNVLGYLFIATKWSLFHERVAAWQVVRAVQMLAVTVATYALLRRFGLGAAGAFVGAALMVVSAPAARGWVRLTMAEPFGTSTILCSALIGTYYQGARHWRALAASIGALVALTLMMKELLVAAIPVVLFIAWSYGPDRSFHKPRLSRRNIGLFAVVAGVAVLTLVPMAVIAFGAPTGAYVSAYGSVGAGPLDLLRLELLTLIPWVAIADPTPPGLAAAGLCYIALLLVGLKLFAATVPSRWHFAAILGIGLIHPMLGAIGYLPWPAYQWFYAIPFLLGPSTLLAAAMTGIEKCAPRWRLLGYGAAAGVLANMASESMLFARRTEASQFLVSSAVDVVATARGLDSVAVAAREIPAQSWQAFGQTLARYGNATGRAFPTTFDVPCIDASARAHRQPSSRTAMLIFSNHCVVVGSPTMVLVRRFNWLDWGRLTSRHDSLVVAVYGDRRTIREPYPR
jgi:hypothetical protein